MKRLSEYLFMKIKGLRLYHLRKKFILLKKSERKNFLIELELREINFYVGSKKNFLLFIKKNNENKKEWFLLGKI